MYNIDYENLFTTFGIIVIGVTIFLILLAIRLYYMTANVSDIYKRIKEMQNQNEINVQQNQKIIDLLQKISEQNKKE